MNTTKHIDKLLEIYLIIRREKIQSMAATVGLFGLGLICINFWDLIWVILLEPVGFEKQGNLPAFIGILLVFMSLGTLALDKHLSNLKSPHWQQDKEVFNNSREIFSWNIANDFLQELNERHYRRFRLNRLMNFTVFLNEDAHKFSNPRLRNAADNLIKTSNALIENTAINFTSRHYKDEIVYWDIKEKANKGIIDCNEHKAEAQKLDQLCSNFGDKYAAYISTGRDLGLLDVNNLDIYLIGGQN